MSTPRFVIVCGSGGVGKTSTAAAVGLVAARAGDRGLVITVDPARRLAQALGINPSGHGSVAVEGAGSLTVRMLDTKAGWDALIRRHARDEATAGRVLRNPLYDNITSRFVNSHDYIAMEQVNELSMSVDFDLVVVDTPPSRNGLDLLFAPQRMREFFGGRLLRWLTFPYRNRLAAVATKPFLMVADRLLGAQFLGDVAEFFVLLQSMEKGFIARADEVERLLSSDRVRCLVVASAEAGSVDEAAYLAGRLRARGMTVTSAVANRVVEGGGSENLPAAEQVAARVAGIDAAVALTTVAQVHRRVADTALRHADGIGHLRAAVLDVRVVPLVAGADQESVLESIASAVGRQ
ncbi:MAG: ArsA family ATPase [Acidimicrobiales bacterium]